MTELHRGPEIGGKVKVFLVETFELVFNESLLADMDRKARLLDALKAPSGVQLDRRLKWRELAQKLGKKTHPEVKRSQKAFREWLDGGSPFLLVGGGANSNKHALACALAAPYGIRGAYVVAEAWVTGDADDEKDQISDAMAYLESCMTKPRKNKKLSEECQRFTGDWAPGTTPVLLIVGPLDQCKNPPHFINRLLSAYRDSQLELGGVPARIVLTGRPQAIAAARRELEGHFGGSLSTGPDPIEQADDIVTTLTSRIGDEFGRRPSLAELFGKNEKLAISLLRAVALARDEIDHQVADISRILAILPEPWVDHPDIAELCRYCSDKLPLFWDSDESRVRFEPQAIRYHLAADTAIILLGREQQPENEEAFANTEFWLSRCEGFNASTFSKYLGRVPEERLVRLHEQTSRLLAQIMRRNEAFRFSTPREAIMAERFLFGARDSISVALVDQGMEPDRRFDYPTERSLARAIRRSRTLPDDVPDRDPSRFLTWLDMSGHDLSKLYLADGNFKESVAERTRFNHAHLNKAIFDNTRLTGAEFEGASVRDADFSNSDIDVSEDDVACMTGAIFST